MTFWITWKISDHIRSYKEASQRLIEVNKEVNKFKSEIDEIKQGFQQQRGRPVKARGDSAAIEKQDKSIAQLQKKLNLISEKYRILENELRVAKQNYKVLRNKLAEKERLIAQLRTKQKGQKVTAKGKTGYRPQEGARIKELTAEINRKNQLLAEKDKEILSLQEAVQNTYSLLEDISE